MSKVALKLGTIMTLFNIACFFNIEKNNTANELDESKMMLSIDQYKLLFSISTIFLFIILYCSLHWR